MPKKIHIKSNRIKNIVSGHPWIFSQAIERMGGLESGDICEIYGNGSFIGMGYYNAATDIAVRILSRKQEAIDRGFFIQRFQHLKDQRERWVNNTNAYRFVFGESDNLPGLVIDVYADTLVVQCHTLGIQNLQEHIVQALIEVFSPTCIVSKQTRHSRKREGIEDGETIVLYGELQDKIIITENGFQFGVDITKGQKTGFFLDQRKNRQSFVEYVEGLSVLNCFCYTGGFSVYAASCAKKVTSVDISSYAIEETQSNFSLNGYDVNQHEFICGDVFDYLKGIKPNGFDCIILDPPSFAHKRNQLKQAIKAYTTINTLALEKLPEGGVLVSSSCTTHVDELTFIKILHQCSVNARCQLKVLHSAIQPFDHAYNLHFPEGRYLKFFVLVKEPYM